MRQWQPNDLFWIVRNGFKYTGHAHWVAIEREDEIWAVVAFLTQIQKLDAKAYRDLALGNVHLSQTSGAELATLESVPRASSACARCHGDEGQWPQSNLVRILHGQPADYLLASLKACAEGKRRSGIMQPLAADLAPEDMRELADYYAGLPHPQMPSTSETWRWWSGGGNWSSYHLRDMPQQCRALNRAALVPPQQHDGADEEERSDQKSGEGTAEREPNPWLEVSVK